MIKVNLLRNKVGDTQASETFMAESSGEDTKNAIVRLLVLAASVLMLIIYENQSIDALNQEVVSLQNQLSELQQAAQVKAQEVEGIKDVEAEAQSFTDKLKILKLLSNLRLREVKTLDFMQSAILERVWLKEISFTSSKEKLQEGQLVFRGGALTTEDLSEFVKRLEDSAYLNEVIVVKNQEVGIPGRQVGTMRDFEFTAEVEVRP